MSADRHLDEILICPEDGTQPEVASPGPPSGPPMKPVLTYFNAAGLADQIRLTFLIGGVDFVDRRISHADWLSKYKLMSPTLQCPFLEVEGDILVQSEAILQYAAEIADLLPKSPESRLKGTSITGKIGDARVQYLAFYSISDRETRTIKLRAEMQKVTPKVLRSLEALIRDNQSNEGHILEGRMSYVDVAVAVYVHDLAPEGIIPSLDAYPALSKVHKMVYELPAVSSFMAMTRPPNRLKLLYFNTPGKAHAIRWALAIAGVSFENHYITQEEWRQMKLEDPSARAPILVVDGKTYTECCGILQYAAELGGLVPEDPLDRGRAWAVVKTLDNVFDTLAAQMFLPANQKLAALSLVLPTLPDMLRTVDLLCAKYQDLEGHVVGSRLSFADLFVAMGYKLVIELWAKMLREPITTIDHMKKCYRMVTAIPAVREHDYCFNPNRPVLYYFNLAARAEPIRLMFHYGKIDFEDKRLTFEEWDKYYRSKSPTGQCPLLEVDGVIIPEVRGIIAYVSERVGLNPITYLGRARADEIHSVFAPAFHEQSRVWAAASEKLRQTAVVELSERRLPPLIDRVESIITETQHPAGFIVDNQLTWIDIYIAAEWHWMLQNHFLPIGHRERYPGMTRVCSLVYTLKALQPYLSSPVPGTI